MLTTTFGAFGVEARTDEPHYHKHIRNIAISWACQAHLDSCISDTRDKLEEFKEGKRADISSDHEASVFCGGLLTADMEQFSYVWSLYNRSSDASRRSFYLRSMGCIENEEVLTRFIHTIIGSDDVDDSSDEWLTIMQSVYANGPIGLRVAFDFLRYNYDDFIGL